MSKAKSVPFSFVLEELAPLGPVTRPMFGSLGVYVGERIVMILRDKGPGDADSGVWLAFEPEHEASVVAALPRLCPIELFRSKVAGWKKLSSRSAEFEDDVGVVCRLLFEGDERIGKVPGKKRPRAAKAELSTTRAKPAPTKAKPAPTKAKPAPAKTKLAAVKAKPAPAKAKPAVAKAKPATAKVKPAVAKAKPATAKAKPAVAKGKSTAAKAKPAATKTKPSARKAKPARAVKKPASRGREGSAVGRKATPPSTATGKRRLPKRSGGPSAKRSTERAD